MAKVILQIIPSQGWSVVGTRKETHLYLSARVLCLALVRTEDAEEILPVVQLKGQGFAETADNWFDEGFDLHYDTP
jgi:hypothetical protein